MRRLGCGSGTVYDHINWLIADGRVEREPLPALALGMARNRTMEVRFFYPFYP